MSDTKLEKLGKLEKLEEYTVPLPVGDPLTVPSNARVTGLPLSKLSALQLRMLRLLRESKRPDQISRELGLSKGELATQIRQVLASIGAPDRTALVKVLDSVPRGD